MTKRDIWAPVVLTITILLFFLPLFWPEQKLIVTPDFGKSDAWHFSFATKYLLWESLHQNKLPLWADKIGDGFPIFAEGQIGTFFLPNLFLFRFIHDPVLAYNFSLVTTIIILATGTYVWLRSLGLTSLPSLFGAITFTLSGIVTLQLPHITLLQGFSLMPWILAEKRVPVRAFLLSQQIFSGFPQATFITLLLTFSLVRKNSLIPFLLSVILGLLLGAVQLFPSWEFLRAAGITKGLSSEIASYFSFPLVHVKSFLDPFALGDPKIGTYPHFSEFRGSIFWENTGYVGILPLLLFFIPLRFRIHKTYSFLMLLFSSFLLMWGSGSPLYIVYSIWPFSLFRAPSRFLWVFVFLLTTLASMGWNAIKKKQHLAILIFLGVFNTTNLFFLWRNYHLLAPAKTWLTEPKINTVIPKNAKIMTIGAERTHNTFFLRSGWKVSEPYETLRSTLAPDSNIIWNVASHDVYAGRFLRRSSIFDSLFSNHITTGDNAASISVVGQKLMNLASVTHVVSTLPLVLENHYLPRIYDTRVANSLSSIQLYTNTTALPTQYIARETRVAKTMEAAAMELARETFIPGQTALIEEPIDISSSDLLVTNETYYPGWNAYLGNQKLTIAPVNIKYRGVIVPKGKGEMVAFRYEPQSIRIGAVVSLAAFLVLLSLFRTKKKTLGPASRHRTPDTFAPHRA